MEDQCCSLMIKLISPNYFICLNASLSIVKQLKRSQGPHFKQISNHHSPGGHLESKHKTRWNTDSRNCLLAVGGEALLSQFWSLTCCHWVLGAGHWLWTGKGNTLAVSKEVKSPSGRGRFMFCFRSCAVSSWKYLLQSFPCTYTITMKSKGSSS